MQRNYRQTENQRDTRNQSQRGGRDQMMVKESISSKVIIYRRT